MKKRVLILLIVVALMAFFVGCGNKEDTTPQPQQQQENTSEDNAAQSEEATGEAQPQEQEEQGFDKTLTGMDLLKSLKNQAPKTLYLESETSLAAGGAMKHVTYMKGEFSRIEMEVAGQKSIVIYNANEGATYQYVEGEKEGVKISDGEEMEGGMLGDMAMGMDMEMPDIQELETLFGDDAVARVEMLDGHEVVYVEINMSEEGMEMTMKMWYSTEYHVPMKYEMLMGETSFMTYKVTKLEVNEKLDDGLFTPPSDIEFTTFSMDSAFGD